MENNLLPFSSGIKNGIFPVNREIGETYVDKTFSSKGSDSANGKYCLRERELVTSELLLTGAGNERLYKSELEELDLNSYLINNRETTFIVRVSGVSMIGAGINPGDLLIVDRSLTPQHKQIVVALLNENMIVKRFIQAGKKRFLFSENPHYSPIEITDNMDFIIWGVVKHLIHSF